MNSRGESVTNIDIERVGYTVLGAAVAALAVGAVQLALLRRRTARR